MFRLIALGVLSHILGVIIIISVLLTIAEAVLIRTIRKVLNKQGQGDFYVFQTLSMFMILFFAPLFPVWSHKCIDFLLAILDKRFYATE